jgi:hypothetical protein
VDAGVDIDVEVSLLGVTFLFNIGGGGGGGEDAAPLPLEEGGCMDWDDDLRKKGMEDGVRRFD